MANKDDYLTEYRQFFENFANSVEPNDQLPVKLGSYKFINTEVVGGIVDWCLQYLSRKSCPSSLVAPLIKTTIDEIRQACKKHPVACGFIPNDNVYEPFKLMQTVIRKMNEVCLRYLDNSQLDNLPAPDSTPLPQVSVCASRNARRRMEDRHVIIHDINTMFNIQDSSPSSYYAIFDGHAGPDAASYSAAHLHQFIAESQYYPTDPQRALKEAFLKTDEFFLDKAKIENFRSGTTAVCALLRPKQQTLYVAWVGDSQALLVNRGNVLQIVKPHKPSREDEKVRIESEGGCVMYWGMWRVNGQLAVSRAIGDLKLKPYVIADPDVAVVPLDGNEEFLIMACDGLWDFVSEDDAAVEVYNRVRIQPDNIEDIAEHLVNLAKKQGSRDNISVVVIFLKDPKQIVRKLPGIFGWTTETGADMDNSNNATNNAFDLFDVFQKKNTEGFMDCAGAFKQNGTVLEEKQESDLYFMERPTNGKRNANEFDEYEEDLGPETDVDAIDDVLLSSTIAKAKAIAEEIDNNNPEDEQKVLDVDMELNKQQHTDFNTLMEQREETPTPPADSVRDSSGIADNVAESGEDSEDEWNYYRVDPKKENSPPIETIVKVSEQEHLDLTAEEMSQLNPDAAEFVPVSPTRNVTSPAFNRDILDDKVITQSPRRAVPMDINVPSPVEFQSEVKQRPSEVFEELENHENKNGHQMSSQELMQNFLNGKDINEIEFHPTNFAKNVSDIPNDNFICENKNVNSNDELNMSGVMETVSSPIDTESHDENDFANNFVRNKEQDPMSMSFYQDKDEEGTGFSTNPFDLNKVQMLPNDDELNENNINQPPELPEHIETAETIFSKDIIDIKENEKTENQELLCDLSKSPALEVHSPSVELSSPAGPLSPKSPIPELTDLVSPDITASIKDEHVDDISKSPAFSQHSTATPIDNILKSPETECDVLIHQHPDLSHSPNINEETRSSHSPNVHEELHMSPSPIVHEEPHLSPSPIVHEEPHLSPSPNIHEQPHLSPSPNIHEQPHLSPSPNVHQEPHLSPSPNVHEEPHLSPSPNVHEQPHLSPSPNMIEESKISSIQQENLVDTATDLMSDFVKVAQNEITDILSNVIEQSSTIVDEISQEAIETISEQTSEITHDVEKSGHQFIDNFENEMKDDFNEKIIDLDNVVKEVERDTANYMEDACKFVNKFQDDVNVMNGNVINNFGVEMNQQINLIENELQAVKADTLEDTKEITEKIEHDFDEKVNEICQNTVEEVSHVSKETENLVENQILDQISNVTEIVNTLTDLGDKIENIKEETNQIFDNFMEKSNNLSESLMLDNKESEFIVKPIIPEISTEVKTQIEQLESWKCEYPLKTPEEIHIEQPIDIKHEIITPEYPVPTITSPLEETKGLETPPTTPAVQTTDIEMKSPEPQKIVEAIETLTEVTNAKEQESTVESMKVTEVVEAVTATAALAATAVAATTTAKKTPAKPKNTTTTTKKPLPSKTSPVSPTKPLVSKTSTTVKKTTTTTTKPASAPTKTSTTTVKQTKTPTASPKPATTLSKTSTARPKSMTTTAKTSIEKKPLTNGDVKTPATKPPPIRKLTNGTTTKPTTTTEKLSPSTTKPPISKTTATATARATTAPTKPARSTLPSSTITSKPKSATTKTPTGTTSKTTTNTTNVKSTVTSTVNRTLTATKPKTTTLSSKPKTTVTSTKPAAKAPDTEKQIKETVNKNISASKLTATKPSSTTRTSTTLKKVEAKVPSARSTTTRTTTTTIKSTAMGKKPSEVSKTTITKTTNVSAKVPVKQQNGVDVIQEITTVTVVSEEPHLVKDNSPIDTPIVVDNSQLIDTAIIAD